MTRPTSSRRRLGQPLESIVANRRWARRTLPFVHVVAQDVFVPEFYRSLEAHFHRIERDQPHVFRRDMAGYDASSADLYNYQDGPLGVFVSREWHDLVAEVSGLGVAGTTGDVTASVHHHEIGGASGWPHNDLNPGWFSGPPPGPDEIRLTGDGDVSYRHGPADPEHADPEHADDPQAADRPARETVRAVSLLFYLGNPQWQRGDGGETGLYAAAGRAAPSARVPPVNNSLVLFECTPRSWHGFLSNVRTPRNSVVMWLHRPMSDAVARWGENSIVRW